MIDTCYVGDVRDGLRAFIAAGHRAQTCVTSPPYWGLRDYGTGQWDGGDPAHAHDTVGARNGRGGSGSPGKQTEGSFPSEFAARTCSCGARRIDHQLGLEPTPAEYVANMVEVSRLVRDVLADDGTLWLNIGDSYATGAGGVGECPGGGKQGESWKMRGAMTPPNRMRLPGLKPKDLVGIPWRLAFALQADGWWLRSDIIWHKPNPMPESITDRPTKAHEYLFLLAKSERYYYDANAIKEPSITNGRPEDQRHGGEDRRPKAWDTDMGSNRTLVSGYARQQRKPAGWDTGSGAHGTVHRDGRAQTVEYTEVDATTRNRRTVWTIATEPFSEAHFATFPTALVEPCVLAGARVGDVVLDPFLGSGTTAMVAQSLGRRWYGCELNQEYVAMQRKRTAQLAMAL